ncbi:MAG: sulfatase-like hydrolase/transferase [bacterium]|nr:sulfatase-like hydrolase/transferase [bacterium]
MSQTPNILFLLSDEHSFRFLSSRPPERGGEPCHTPTLDTLIQQGVHFDTAYCQNPVCVPSRVGLLSGRASSRLAVLRPDVPTFASHLGDHGYATATVGKMHLQGGRQFAGFDARPYGDFGGPSPAHQKDPLHLPGERDHIFMPSIIQDVGLSDIPESLLQERIVIAESLAWLREHRHTNPDQPWLLYASFVHPHFPLNAPRRFFERYYPTGVTPPKIGRTGDAADHPMTLGALRAEAAESQGHYAEHITEAQTLKARAAYFACVDQFDELLGDFLALLNHSGFLDNTVIVYTSDHGELCGEHGLWWKRTYHEASTRVPLIISLPEHRTGILAPSEITTPVSLADLFPTLCGLTGTPIPDDLDGLNLSPALQGASCPSLDARPGVIVEHLAGFNSPDTQYRMIRSHRYKYIAFRNCEALAFDLHNDPDEQHNLLQNGDPPQALEPLKTHLLTNFDFNQTEARLKQERASYLQQYPKRVDPHTSNQIFLKDGRLVEADSPLERPNVVSENPAEDFDDFPE